MRLRKASPSPCLRVWLAALPENEIDRTRSIRLDDISGPLRQREQVVARSDHPRSTSNLDGCGHEIGVATRPSARTPSPGKLGAFRSRVYDET